MLPALSTKPKQAVRQVKGLTNDSIDAYSNTPMGGGSIASSSYADNTTMNDSSGALSARANARKTHSHSTDDGDAHSSGVLARVVRDRKASGDEELSLKAGDVVHVLSTKRTGYLKCAFGNDEGYVPSSYLEFFDGSGAAAAVVALTASTTDASDKGGDENPRAERRKKKKEKRAKEKKLAAGGSDPEEAVMSPRSPRKGGAGNGNGNGGNGDGSGDDGDMSPRKSKKKSSKKHRHGGGKADDDDGGDAPATKRGDETERRKAKKPHKKKRHHESSASSESDDDGSRHRKSRRHRRSHRRGRGGGADSDSDASESSSSSSDSGYTRRRRRHRHRKASSSDDDDYDSDKRKARHRGRRRGRSHSDDDGADTARSSRRGGGDKKRGAEAERGTPRGDKTGRDRDAAVIEKGVAKLDVHTDTKPVSRSSEVISDHIPEQETSKKTTMSGAASGGSSGTGGSAGARDKDESKSKSARTRKDDENRTESNVAVQKAKTNLGKQIGDKMRSLLGGGKKTERSHKSSSGILNACPGTTQGEEGWYEHGESERYYFVLLDGKWSLLYGPMTEEDFETCSNKVLEQSRMVELPPTYLHKAGYFLNQELRVQKV